MKRKYSFAIVIILSVIAMVTKRFVLIPGIDQLLFVPYTFYFFILLTKLVPRYSHVLGFTMAGLIISLIMNSTADTKFFLELTGTMTGCLLTLLSVALYKRLIKSSSDIN